MRYNVFMKYDYVIILCADKKNCDGEFPEFRNGDYIGGKNRMDVALEYSLLNPETTFIVTGGLNPDDGKCVYRSQKVLDMANFLKEGNSGIKLISVPSLPCIHHNFVAILNKLHSELCGKRVAILTSYLYVPRTLAIWSKLTKMYPGIPVLHILCSESFINNEDVIKASIELYMKRVFRERQGMHDLELGEYEDFCLVTQRDKFIELARKYPILVTEQERAELL